ncbi:hypothetical protein GQ602_002556 [Ophiocordyceps camponoti-floridani]|uniref:Uncharacterized protein n=1 Tax=Ophiocordyceps camponoti-floridani TaxID=2030778 RepID=A0A8H4VFI8_9HYPO|nr:hypothetical protein GQ602_002556 [Ophiocordyceps camponoti-floridani]
MFELPEAKRVRREDLEASDNESQNDLGKNLDTALRESLQARLAKSLGELLPHAKKPANEVDGEGSTLAASSAGAATLSRALDPGDEAPDEFEFRLFSTAGSVPKITLDIEERAEGESNIVAKRPPSYYLATDIPEQLRQEYRMACISGEDVVARSRCRSWGLELPWKVTTITTVRNATPEDETAKESVANAKTANKKRPGKKTRIAQRRRGRAARDREQLAAKQEMDKSEHLKNKKMRLNRTKKLRRRAKDKEKRLAAVMGDAHGAGADDEAGASN